MRRISVNMRWWLALAFAAIAAVTAFAVAEVLTQRAQQVLSDRAEEIATGSSVAAARELTAALAHGDLSRSIEVLAAGRRLSLFVFNRDGRPISEEGSRGVRFGADPLDRRALARALAGRRFVEHDASGNRIVVGLHLRSPRASALVAGSSTASTRAAMGAVRVLASASPSCVKLCTRSEGSWRSTPLRRGVPSFV